MNDRPSEEEFARAKELDAYLMRNLDHVYSSVMSRFRERCRIVEFEVMDQGENAFMAFVFFKTNDDVESYKANGIVQEITDYVYDELERAGRGKRNEISVVFEFDSAENVQKNFNGDYFMRCQ